MRTLLPDNGWMLGRDAPGDEMCSSLVRRLRCRDTPVQFFKHVENIVSYLLKVACFALWILNHMQIIFLYDMMQVGVHFVFYIIKLSEHRF